MKLQEIANTLDDAAKKAEAVEQISEKHQFDLEQAYDIQRLSIDNRKERGEKVVGYKLGFTSYAKMEQMGVHDLIWGILTDEMTIKSGETVDLNRWIHPRSEPEIAFRVGKEITNPISLDEVPQYIDKMASAIEIIDSRYKNFKFSLEDVVADNCSSTGYVLGKWQDLKADSISDLAIHLKINDEIVEKGKTSAILDNPLKSIVELSRLATEAGLKIEEGQVILAGAATAAVYLKPNDKVESELEGLGKVAFEVK